jgi:osmotically inducible lipoprotein OsmB
MRVRSRPVATLVMGTALFTCACASLNTTQKGALGGGMLGAGAGALIGHQTHHTAGGAAIGGALGLLTGGLVGNQLQQGEERSAAQQSEINRQQREINKLKKQQSEQKSDDRY